MGELLEYDKTYFQVDEAYVENGVVYIKGLIKANFDINISRTVIPEEYVPRTTTYGWPTYWASSSNVGKIFNVNIRPNGELYVWANKMNNNEIFSIQYPLKVK